ncbi:Acyltransferase family protein [compost metagenome]
MPAAIAVIVVTLAAASLLFSSARFVTTIWDGIWATFFGANWRFAVLGTDYFQAGGPVSPLQHYWSLAVEEQFYFIWPWLMLLIFWAVSRRRSSARDARRAIGLAIVLLTAGSFAWSIWETQTNTSWAYFSTFSRAWELGMGAIIAVYATNFSKLGAAIRRVCAWAGLAGVVVAIFVMTDTVAFPGPAAAIPVVAATLLIAAGTGEDRSSLWPLTNPVARYLGDISYSLYLWHFPVAILLLTIYPGDSGEYYIFGALAILALSVASFHMIEDPIRKSRWPNKARKNSRNRPDTRTRMAHVGLAALTAVTAVTVISALAPPEIPVSSTPIAGNTSGGNSGAQPTKVKCWGAAALDPVVDCERELGADAAPNPKTLSEDTGNSYDCFPQAGKQMKTCTYGGGATHVAIVGDSHAASLLPGLSEQAKSQGWTLDTFVGVGCIWVRQSCTAMDEIQTKLLEGDYDLVITSAYRGSGNTDKEAQASAFAATWQPVARAGAKVIVVEDVPMSTGPAVQCVQRLNFNVLDNDCAIEREMAYKAEDAAALAVQDTPNAAIVETSKYFCTDVACPAVIGNVLVYRDDIAHISATYSTSLGPYLAKDITAAAATLKG